MNTGIDEKNAVTVKPSKRKKEKVAHWAEVHSARRQLLSFGDMRIFPSESGPGFTVKWMTGNAPRKKTLPTMEAAEEFAVMMKQAQEAALTKLEESAPGSVELLAAFARKVGPRNLFDKLMSECSRIEGVPIEEAMEVFLKSLEDADRTAHYRASMRWALNKFVRVGGAVHELTGEKVREALNGVTHQGSLRYIRTALHTFWKFCAKREMVSKYADCPADTMPEQKRRIYTPEIFTPDEMVQLLAHASSPEYLTYLIIGGFCGARPAEVLRLQWEHWRPDTKSLVFPCQVTKTSRRRVCNVEDNVVQWLKLLSIGKRPDEPMVRLSASDLADVRAATEASAGVMWKQNALRHSYASYHLEKYGNAPITAKNCGHRVEVMETHYMQITDKAAADRWFNIVPEA